MSTLALQAGELFFKTGDVKDFLGLSQGQVNAARRRDDLKTVQFKDGGDCYFYPDNVLDLQQQILKTNHVGSARLARRVPKVESRSAYESIQRKLVRFGYEPAEFADLVESDNVETPGWEIAPYPSNSGGRKVQPQEPDRPDYFPFEFDLGDPEAVPVNSDAAAEFERVKDNCFGHFDETNRECEGQCDFSRSCAFARYRLLTAMQKAQAQGNSLQEAADAALEDETQWVEQLLQ